MRKSKKHAIEILREQAASMCRGVGVKLSARPNKAELEQIVKGICFENAEKYFGIEL